MSTYKLSYQGKAYKFHSLSDAQEFLDKLPSRAGVEIVDGPLLFHLLNAPGAPFTNWQEIIEQINDEFGQAKTEDMRDALLATFNATMNIVESQVDPEKLSVFQDARRRHYKSFIVQEALVGQNICMESLSAITGREVAAGRMAPDDNLRKNALYSMMAPHLSRAELIAMDAEKRGLPLSTSSSRLSLRQHAMYWMGRAKARPMAQRLSSWFRSSIMVHLPGRSQIVQYGREALRTYWSENLDISKGFPDEFVKSEAREIMEEVVKVATSQHPAMANRRCLAEYVRGWTRFQVLMLDRQEPEDLTGLRGQPGITGELKEHLFELTQKDDDLRQFMETVGPVSNWDDAWKAVAARCYVMYAWAHVFHTLRMAFDDMNREKDWFKPFVAAMCAWQEHHYRASLGLPPSLAKCDTDADLRSLAMSGFESCVTEGFRDPEVEWHRRLEEVERATKPSLR